MLMPYIKLHGKERQHGGMVLVFCMLQPDWLRAGGPVCPGDPQSKKDRKCLYFLPLCPVYGFGAVLILLLPPAVRQNPWLLFPCAALTATAAEYLLGLFYERVAKVQFWDYSHLPLNVGGKVCLLFTAMWGALAMGLVYWVHPWVALLVSRIPGWLTLPAVLFLGLDIFFTLYVLRRERSTDALLWYKRLGNRRRQET